MQCKRDSVGNEGVDLFFVDLLGVPSQASRFMRRARQYLQYSRAHKAMTLPLDHSILLLGLIMEVNQYRNAF